MLTSRNNRLLLWASEDELKEVRKFLVKLGEITGGDANPHTVRTLEPRDAESTMQLLEQLRRAWPSVGSNPLRIEIQPSDVSPKDEDRSRPVEPVNRPDDQDEAARDASASTLTALVDDNADTAAAIAMGPTTALAELTLAQKADPESLEWDLERGERQSVRRSKDEIVISVTPDGRVVLSSRDTQALDMLEEVIARISPASKRYESSTLKHAMASLVTLNLEEYFEDETDSKSNDSDNYWRGCMAAGCPIAIKKRRAISSVCRKIRFIYDYDTNSILVSNASPAQLETVRQLIKVYDRPISEESVSARRFKIFTLRFARAEDVADTIKDVYRDLLSSKDKAFAKNQNREEQTSQSTNYYRIFGSSDGDDKKPKKVKASFAGALSVGVDARSNTLIVSAQEEWLPSIAEMIRFLDDQAEPVRPTVQVINTQVSASALQAALSRALGESSRQVEIKEGTQKPSGKEEAKEPSPDAAKAATASAAK